MQGQHDPHMYAPYAASAYVGCSFGRSALVRVCAHVCVLGLSLLLDLLPRPEATGISEQFARSAMGVLVCRPTPIGDFRFSRLPYGIH